MKADLLIGVTTPIGISGKGCPKAPNSHVMSRLDRHKKIYVVMTRDLRVNTGVIFVFPCCGQYQMTSQTIRKYTERTESNITVMQRPERGEWMENGTVIQVFGEPIEILASSTATNHAFVIGLQTSPPGGGPPPHRHLGEDEIFTVVDGEFEFFDGTSWIPMHRGETRYSLRGSYHAFRNAGDSDGKMLFVTNGGGLDEYFAEISSLRLPDDLERLLEIGKFYRHEYLPASNNDSASAGKAVNV